MAGLSHDDGARQRALVWQGLIEFQMGREEEAEASIEKAFLLNPDSVEAAYGYGAILMVREKYDKGLAVMRRVVALEPDHAKAYHAIGRALGNRRDHAGAIDAFGKSLKINPQNLDVLTDMGNMFKDMGRLAEAALFHEKALSLKPDSHTVMNNLGVVRFLSCDLDGAETLYKAALSIHPDLPEALINLASVLEHKGDLETAISYCQKALALRPDYPEAFNNLGNALKDARRLDEAVAAYEQALRLRPEEADFHMNLAMALLSLGRFDEGWREYKWRWQSRQLRGAARDLGKPEWEGEAGEGRVILIHAEQGFGDTLQFCRYALAVRERGLRVIMLVQRPLARLIRSLDGVEKVLTDGDEVPDFDLHCPMMSLPFALRTTVDTIPAAIPYLRPEPADVNGWRDRMAELPQGDLRVGLVWAGKSRSRSPDLVATNRERSLTPESFAPLLGMGGVQFFSLQKDGARAPEALHLIDWMENCNDFADTAALIMNLDLVIGVDTAVVHLAGALGKPFWMLNRFNSCWRWLANRDDSPWYPGLLRLFPQKQMGNWEEVFARVRSALVKLVAGE